MRGSAVKGAVALVALVLAAPPVWAGIPVHDAAAQSVRVRQLREAREHLEKAKEIVFTLRGASGYGGALPSLEEMHGAPPLEEVKRVFANLAGGGSGTAAIEGVRRRARVPLWQEVPGHGAMASEDTERRENERARVWAYYQLRAEEAYLLAERRRPALTGLQDALEGAAEVKDVLALQTLVLIEVALQLNDNNQLLATLLQMQAHKGLLDSSSKFDAKHLP
ncbi:MAG: hypothetical protein OXU81_23055 [Gammaproteobacteria bacterium]|nr:hypothetical protein [Gammaproteobacteria bacterium]